ncbi:long-chain fatty acid--CoA ligase [Actinoplanes sp. NPDC049265]|uniref:long-chain-fatty-acid--CoA ligase n=1 Tax=Actinoplanes sp. NPDC049265 TaxID=3363902 RepID=UPI00371639E3
MNLAGNLVHGAHQFPGRPAIRLHETVLTYADLDRRSAAVAAMLAARQVRPGDRIAVMLPNVPEFAVVYHAILRVGAVVVPMNPLLKEREVSYCLGDSQARMIFAGEGCAEAANAGAARSGIDCTVVEDGFGAALPLPGDRRVRDREPSDTAVILYTSGTTGQPKGAELTHANLATNAEVSAELFRLGPDDVIFGGLPLFHSFGQTCGLNATIRAGAGLTLVPRFVPDVVLDVLARHRVTVFEGVPTMYVALLRAAEAANGPAALGALRVCVSGGAALPVEVLHGFEKTFECTVLEGYGLSETSPVASFNHPGRPRKPGSIGTPIRGVRIRLVDDAGADVPPGEIGEIAIRGHNVMKGYWRRPEATAEAIPDGWFRSGDLARIDDEGYLFIVDRKKELIIRGGHNVYPREIEEVLYEHPAVLEAAVVGIPDPALGEEVGAAVVLRPGATETVENLKAHVKNQVAAYKYPRHVWLLDALPKGPTGKILKREINPPTADVHAG